MISFRLLREIDLTRGGEENVKDGFNGLLCVGVFVGKLIPVSIGRFSSFHK